MNLFGGKFCTTKDKRQCSCGQISDGMCRCERKNFDSLLWAIVTVFQVRLYLPYVAYSTRRLFSFTTSPLKRASDLYPHHWTVAELFRGELKAFLYFRRAYYTWSGTLAAVFGYKNKRTLNFRTELSWTELNSHLTSRRRCDSTVEFRRVCRRKWIQSATIGDSLPESIKA